LTGLTTALETLEVVLVGAIAALDSLPDPLRAMLAALLLAVFLRFFEVRIAPADLQLGQSFRKATLVALLVIPVLVWLFPASRMVVFVEELPQQSGRDHWAWQLVVGLWALGALAALTRLLIQRVQSHLALRACPKVDDEKLERRLSHWQNRLGIHRLLDFIRTSESEPRPFASLSAVCFPAGADHWPGSTQDVLMIQALCRIRLKHRRWYLMTQLVICVYWPVIWIGKLQSRLLADFQRAADELARSCYQDQLGYQRAARQLAQRLDGGPVPGLATPRGATPPRRLQPFQRLIRQTNRLMNHHPEPSRRATALESGRDEDADLSWTDPYDKVVLFVGQAVFLAFLLTGVTLREKPPDLEYEYAMPFELLWKEHFHRNQELLDRFQGAP
jgi:hypothetical protein